MSFSSDEFLFVILFGAAVGTAIFFHADRNRIKHPSGWASAVFVCPLIGLPLYALYVRRVNKQRTR